MQDMWKDFSDFELTHLAGQYGLEDSLVFDYEMGLANREEIEELLTRVELDFAFGVDINCELV